VTIGIYIALALLLGIVYLAIRFRPARTVAIGALHLDENKPDWYTYIVGEKLKMHSLEYCVLAQVYGNYGTGTHCLGISNFPFGSGEGFAPFFRYKKTKRLWIEAAESRRRTAAIIAAPIKKSS